MGREACERVPFRALLFWEVPAFIRGVLYHSEDLSRTSLPCLKWSAPGIHSPVLPKRATAGDRHGNS